MAQAVDVPKVYRGLLLDQPDPAGLLGGLQSGLGDIFGSVELRQFRTADKKSADR